MEQLTFILGVLGVYFAVVLVLAICVETILEPFTSFRELQKRVSPDDVLNDIKGWLHPISDIGTRAAAIANLGEEYKVNIRDVQARLNVIKTVADETAKGLGGQKQVDDAEKKIAVYMAALRAKFAIDERKRITILRLIAAAIGVALAALLKIDTFAILGTFFPPNVHAMLTSPGGQIGGTVITGLAASAGSSFWHDQLGRLRAIKESAQGMS
jgi:hypothetical protein